MRRFSAWPWLIAAATAALATFAVVLGVLAGSHGDPWWQTFLALSAVAASVTVGLLIAVKRPGHPIGWLLLANGAIEAGAGVAQGYAQYATQEHPGALPGAEWAVLWDQSAWPLLFGLLTAIVLVFPDGKLSSPRLRRVAVGAVAAFALLLLLGFFDSEPFEAPYQNVERPLPSLPRMVCRALAGCIPGRARQHRGERNRCARPVPQRDRHRAAAAQMAYLHRLSCSPDAAHLLGRSDRHPQLR